MNNQESTTVIFRKFKDRGDIIALFPYEVEQNGCVGSYQTIGQHCEADYNHCMNTSVRASPSEYASLKSELESIGYQLTIRLKRNRK